MAEPAWAGTDIGRSMSAAGVATEGPLRRLAATLDRHWDGGTVPLLGHWLYHLPDAAQAALGPDGHPAAGFVPPMSGRRRMWAGGRFHFLAPIRVGATIVRHSTIVDVVDKRATLTLVTLRHVIVADGVEAVVEEQDLAFLPLAPPGSPKPVAVPDADIERAMTTDAALLFRFSALTFNAHRIHYDADYARTVEHYPGLVVHGPLQAMLLLDLAQDDGVKPASFAFRARAPLYAGEGFTLCRAGPELWIRDRCGDVTMTASVAA